MNRVPVDLPELEVAFDHSGLLGDYWLDLETGDVLLIDEETQGLLSDALELVDEAAQRGALSIAEAVARSEAPDWQQEAVLRWHELSSSEGRLLPIPPADSKEGYDDMVAFIERLDDLALRDLLAVAIRGKGAFRRFKDVLDGGGEARERWFAFKSVRLRERMASWLESEGIEPIDRPPDEAAVSAGEE